jgi:siroheme decarboxylase
MKVELTDLQKRLCDALQDGLPVCSRPFAAVGLAVGASEMSALTQTAALRRMDVIRRIGPIIDYRVLGRVSTLVAAHVQQDDIERVAAVVSALSGVSHNYMRDHSFNLWFTLQGNSAPELDAVLARLSEQVGIEFHSLPVVRSFKLDVRFGLSSMPRSERAPIRDATPVTLSDRQRAVLGFLQDGLEIVPQPFCEHHDVGDTIAVIESLVACGVIKRLAATLNYRALGFTTNVMFCCAVPEAAVESAGLTLAGLDMVSHCYERRAFAGWPYNLFAMMHARSADEVSMTVQAFAASNHVHEYALLPTVKEFKKAPVRLL